LVRGTLRADLLFCKVGPIAAMKRHRLLLLGAVILLGESALYLARNPEIARVYGAMDGFYYPTYGAPEFRLLDRLTHVRLFTD
jgi:hypothetical protein